MKNDPILPPAIVQKAESLDECLRAAHGLAGRIVEDFQSLVEWLDKAHAICPKGEWEAALRRHGFNPNTVRYWRMKGWLLKGRPLAPNGLEVIVNDPASHHLPNTSGNNSSIVESPGFQASPQIVYCRPCRTTGVKEGCKVCAELRASRQNLFSQPSGPASGPAEAGPPPDAAPSSTVGGSGEGPDEGTPTTERPAFEADSVGIPERVKPAFETKQAIKGWCERLKLLRDELNQLSRRRGGRMLPVNGFEEASVAFEKRVMSSSPAHVCPDCRGEKAECALCLGEGWVTEADFNGDINPHQPMADKPWIVR